MNADQFEKTLSDIQILNGTEGPNRNIYEPKFQAREQAEMLKKSVLAKWNTEKSATAQDQLAQLHLFIGTNMYETEEDKDALVNLSVAYSAVVANIEGKEYDFDKLPYPDVVSILRVDEPLSNKENGFKFVSTYVEVLNSLGVYLAQQEEKLRIDDARKVVHIAEKCYEQWNDWFLLQPDGCSEKDVKLDEDYKIVVDPQSTKNVKLRHLMDSHYTSSLFYLAQAYGLKSNVRLASKYCHLTMVRQLMSKKEFSKKEWATNALQLSSFYTTEEHFGCSLHCLEAGRYIMPKKPADEETLGIVAWAFGKYHKGRLRHFLQKISEGEKIAPKSDQIGCVEWWMDFPLPIDPPKPQPIVTDLPSAVQEFKLAYNYMKEAKKYYLYEGSCTDHIKIIQDQAELLMMLSQFEKDDQRIIAMHMKRHDLLKKFPEELNPQAYTVMIRQLNFDLADITSDILDLRIAEKKAGKPTALSDKKVNLINQRARNYLWNFVNSYKEKDATELPKKVDSDNQLPLFRALMRIAGLETKQFYDTPKEEYDAIGIAIERYDQCVKFAENNNLGSGETAHEVNLAREMAKLLPNKQKELVRVYN